jgi:molybdopterin-synthase adenylyltransferase
VDHDAVDLTNLQRQIAHNLERVGHPKAESARDAVAAINPDVMVRPLVLKADAQALDELVPQADVVIDCCDNFATRHLINQACVAHGKPLVSGAAIRFDGQLSVFDARRADSPCYACMFPPDQDFEEVRCATMGVFAPLVGIIGAMQASEALRLLAGVGTSLVGRLQMLEGRTMEWSEVRVKRDPGCWVCGALRR